MWKKIVILVIVFLLLISISGTVIAQSGCGNNDSGSIFFSEYVEGSSNNKALEIFNGYGAAVDLSNFEMLIYFNGSSSAGTTIALSGTLAPGDVFVLADNDADASILAVADQTSTASFFNGDDAIELRQVTSQQDGSTINVTHDVIGQIGDDPGSEWGTGNTSTQNNTIRRQSSIAIGDSDGSDSFDPSTEWDGYPQDTFDGLGTHTATCTPTAITFASMNASKGVSNSLIIALLAGFSVLLFGGFWLRRRISH